MPPTDSPSIISLLKKYNLHPRKGLGQNFLVDSFHLEKIIEAADLSPEDTVVEIGPGPGTLTRRLIETAGRIIAVELDAEMVSLLQAEYGDAPHLTIVEADILQTPLETLIDPFENFKVVANLPYYITSAVMRHLLVSSPRPQRLVVTVQKEVAHRMVAEPGNMSILAVSVQFYGRPKIVHHIPAGAFYPSPKVDSAVVCIDTFSELPIASDAVDHFFRVVKAGYSQKRKQLKNSLAAGLRQSGDEVVRAMESVEIDPTRRAETLALDEWQRLAQALSEQGGE